MATTTLNSTDQASVDASLWWDSFTSLLAELENVSPSSSSSDHRIPLSLVNKLKDNHAWFLDTVSLFKPPSQKSREALNSRQLNLGTNQLTIHPQLKDVALKISSLLGLDEVQSYILVNRTVERNTLTVDAMYDEVRHLVLLHYYIERQCLLKCTRQILMHALHVRTGCEEGSDIGNEAETLISEGLESKLLSVLQDLLSATYGEHMDVDLLTLWAEETLIEDNLILDILFVAYYESFCTCNGNQWKQLCSFYEGMIFGSFNFGRLAISTEAIHSIYQAKVQLLLILIETLDLESLLQMIHDETPFSKGSITFNLSDIQELDAIISSFHAFEAKEAGALILTWAVFLCLIASLPERAENNGLMDIDHVGHVRQAFEVSSLSYVHEILQSNVLKNVDGPVVGYRSVLRTFLSAFIASYEISVQLEDNNLRLILDILCEIYRGEESLCIQFWDKDSYIDGPIRCLLCNLEGEFPFRTVELVRLLSALCEGNWPSECVYNFLDKSVGLSSLFEFSSGSVVDTTSQIVETHLPLPVPGVEGLIIPSRTRGFILKMIDQNRALVRWEYTRSGVVVLLLRFAQHLYFNITEEALKTLDLFCRLVTFNTAVCYALMETDCKLDVEASRVNPQMENIKVVDIICSLIKNAPSNCDGAVMMSMGLNILAKMLRCSPSQVTAMTLKANIFDPALMTNLFDVVSSNFSSGSGLVAGRLAKLLLIDCEQNDSCCPLTISVLEFTMQLVESGVRNDLVQALIIFSLQYILVSHEHWKYKVRRTRWNVTLKVLEVLKKCILSMQYSQKEGEVVFDILFSDASLHNALFRIVCTTTQTIEKLYVSRFCEVMEIEGLQLAICSVLDILYCMLSDISKGILHGRSVFHQAMLSPMTKPVPVFIAMISLISFFRNPRTQVGAAKVLSMLFVIADQSAYGNAWFGLDNKQISEFRNSVARILHQQLSWNKDLIVATLKLLTSAANHQPAFLAVVIAAKETTSSQLNSANGLKPLNEAADTLLTSKDTDILDAIQQFVEKSGDLVKSNPKVLFNVLNFLKALWQGAAQYADILEWLKNPEMVWRQLLNSVLSVAGSQDNPSKDLAEDEILNLAYRYQCQSDVLQIMAHEIFLHKNLLHVGIQVKQTSEVSIKGTEKADKSDQLKDSSSLKDIFSTWFKCPDLVELIKNCASCEYDTDAYNRAKITAALFAVHVMGKLRRGDMGGFSVFLLEKIRLLSTKLCNLRPFSELSSHYIRCGYSDGDELINLILSDLYYYLQGELEGRKIEHRAFKELSQYLLESEFLQIYRKKVDEDLTPLVKDVYLFDLLRMHEDMGLDIWSFSEWKASKVVAETLLHHLRDVNSMVVLTNSKLATLRAFIAMLTVYFEDSSEQASVGGKIPEHLLLSCIHDMCQRIYVSLGMLAPISDAIENIVDFLAAQVQLLHRLIRSAGSKMPLPACVLVLKTSGSGLKILSDFRSSVPNILPTIEHFLMLLLSSIQLFRTSSVSDGMSGTGSVEVVAEVSNVSLGLLPVLCNCIEPVDHLALALSAIDLVLKGLLTPDTWFPIIKKHLPLQHVLQKLQDRCSLASTVVVLKFLLTITYVRGGAEMLINAGLFTSLREFLANSPNGMSLSVIHSDRSDSLSSDQIEKPQQIWGLALAVITAVIQSLGDSSFSADIVEHAMTYFLLEKAYLISHYISAPNLSSDGLEKRRPSAQRNVTSLSGLRDVEHTLLLICMLAKHGNSWIKIMKGVDSELRERSIHLLAFISKGAKNLDESTSRVAPLLCHPTHKDEFEWYTKPSFIHSRNGWFALCAIGCGLNSKYPLSSVATAIAIKDQITKVTGLPPQTYFSDTMAVQIYRITFVLLKFLCVQAEEATRRAEEVGIIDLSHFPELPMPDILHGLQDQGIAIVTELCEATKIKQVSREVQGVCILLLQIIVKALYLELCVSQVCGMRPVLGRFEDFLKEIKLLLRATDEHAFLQESINSLKQIISFVYPGLMQVDDL